jgi:phosphate transport system permease protein
MQDSERGLAGLLVTGLATLLVLVLLLMLLWVVAANAVVWFWPMEISEIRLADGQTVIGQLVGSETATGANGGRIRLKVGSRELNGRDFLWIDEGRVRSVSRPDDLIRVVRTKYGDAYGRVAEAVDLDGNVIDGSDRRSVVAVLDRAGEAQKALRSLERRQERVRRPLTSVEHRLHRLRRSRQAEEPKIQATISRLEARDRRLHDQLGPELDELAAEIAAIRQRLAYGKIVLDNGTGRVVVPMHLLVEAVWPNDLNVVHKTALAATRCVQFLFDEPRAANTEGGIYPALFGTVLMVILMSLAVMPLGVVAAVYLDEYAAPGPLVRLVRRAINNLAGVPSIVFGMFGLAFFVYGVGGAADRAFFADDLPAPTFGTGGILWASLTLAVLTIPVVVVATREGLQAVPRGWREGSRALGATRWQTLKTIVLPAAAPGMLTGFILAVGRAAGEVAPLMLTGAVKLAHGLPIDGEAPFVHLQRKFMHLGFHIYDVSMQSPDVEAAKPMAFAATVVLLGLVVAINLTAIFIRRRLHSVYRVLEE